MEGDGWRPAAPPAAGDLEPPPEFDAPAEVDALFRAQRRVAVGWCLVFLVVTLGVPLLTLVVDWWSSGLLVSGMSPNFAVSAVGLYVFFLVVALAACSAADTVDDGMLGGKAGPGDDRDDPAGGP